MHIDARKIDDASLIEGDICIIGAGAAGISMALEWNNTPFKVILLEGGGFTYEDKVQELYDGKVTGQPYYPLKAMRLHYFGGTTGHWGGFCSTFDRIDFRKRDWVPNSGWPIERDDLDPYYARAHKYLDLGPYEYSLDYWQGKDPLLIPLVSNSNVVWNKMWQFSSPVSRFGTKYKDEVVNSRNIHLYTYANVTDIVSDENVSVVKEVTIKNHAGKSHTVKARKFVLACSAIQNARLLLASNKQASKGLGNNYDLVGRNFMEHVEIFGSAELWLKRPDPLKLYIKGPDTKARAELAMSEKIQREHQILNGTISINPLFIEKSRRQKLGSLDTKNIAYELITRMEQSPNPSSRVTLSPDKDSLGVPRASLHWELTSLEKQSIRKMYELVGHEIRRAGTGVIQLSEFLRDEKDMSWPSFTGGGQHHMGTTRMSESKKKGVVDKHCKVHGISNLYIAGSSCFPTGAAPNPTLTLTALSLRLSDHLKTKLTDGS